MSSMTVGAPDNDSDDHNSEGVGLVGAPEPMSDHNSAQTSMVGGLPASMDHNSISVSAVGKAATYNYGTPGQGDTTTTVH